MMAPRLRQLSSALGLALALAVSVSGGLVGCASQQRPALQVVAVEQATRTPVLLVQVTNPERRPIRLQRLAYTFASSSNATSGEVRLSRDVAAGAAVIVEVPIKLEGVGPFHLEGSLTALMDRIERTYSVHAAVPADDATPRR